MSADRDRDDGGAAFPVCPPVDSSGRVAVGMPEPEAGMTLRDYFAAHAIPLVARQADLGNAGTPELAAACFEFADEMLLERIEPLGHRMNHKRYGEEQYARSEALADALKRLYEVTAAMDAELEGERPTDADVDAALAYAKGLLDSEDDIPF